jgi:hypothetical protein
MSDFSGDALADYTPIQAVFRNIATLSADGSTAAGTVITYTMRAYETALLAYVTWSSTSTPDLTGDSSGYTPANLRGISVIKRTTT